MLIETSSRTERRRTVVFLIMCVVIGLLAAPIRPGIVLGESMAPAFHSGQVFLTTRVRHPEILQRGDVVLLMVDGQLFLKRIRAVGGDRVWALISEDEGSPVERIISTRDVAAVWQVVGRYRGLGELVEVSVPEGHVYVLGDSQSNSYDSRHFGPVPWEAIRGRVVVAQVFRLWSGDRNGPQVAMAGEVRERQRR